MAKRKKETWNSNIGAILAVAGGAVGLGNFLRFPGQVAQYGGGAFMLAYFISLILIGLPLCWAEWTIGRHAGKLGFHSCPGVLNAIWNHRFAKYAGVIGVCIPLVIYMYYIYIASWCFGYAFNYALGNFHFDSTAQAVGFWEGFVGIKENGSAFGFTSNRVGFFLIAVFLIDFFIIYRGVTKGIEAFCKYAMPSLLVMSLIVLVRVLTLGTPDVATPHNNINNGLGFLWNPNKITLQAQDGDHWHDLESIIGPAALAEAQERVAADTTLRLQEKTVLDQLQRPKLWLAAASQVFFSLTVGFGVILTYASYLKRNDDVVLSGLSAVSANEFAEVALGGLISVPAGFAFLGAAGLAGQSSFGLGFHVLPMVFSSMPLGNLFGFTFFSLLSLSAIASTLAMLQPGIAFLEEGMEIGRKRSAALLVLICGIGCAFVVYFSKDVKALDTLDFWIGSFLIFLIATINSFIYGWGFGAQRILKEAKRGACFPIPKIFGFIIKYISPFALLSIAILWFILDVLGIGAQGLDHHIAELTGTSTQAPNPVAWFSVVLILFILTFLMLIASRAQHYKDFQKKAAK
tara:strand:- start:42408 stop:44129 length:1722 start_codon:yes stop_codon:yes gene_type:complete